MTISLVSNIDNHGTPTFLAVGVSNKKWAVSFMLTQSAYIDHVDFILQKSGSPVGTAYSRIWSLDGVYPNDECLPIGDALAQSDAFDISSVTTQGWYSLIYSTPYLLHHNIPYFISFDTEDGDASNRVGISVDIDETIYPGNTARYYLGQWFSSVSGNYYDLFFNIYGTHINRSIQGVQAIQGIQSLQF